MPNLHSVILLMNAYLSMWRDVFSSMPVRSKGRGDDDNIFFIKFYGIFVGFMGMKMVVDQRYLYLRVLRRLIARSGYS